MCVLTHLTNVFLPNIKHKHTVGNIHLEHKTCLHCTVDSNVANTKTQKPLSNFAFLGEEGGKKAGISSNDYITMDLLARFSYCCVTLISLFQTNKKK